ncbi:glycosyltransferase [Rhodopirellula sallentina]|uniref:Glycosyltransferase n=1 Tax=Rhodopirellula sallentina SM41 TaxID=1263870 RepID=M5U2U1_9BACT|nr:glycosyltransferase [Rhodopirellula sallentina]EMI55772.1 glycosyltransferase [Rhodopirellula sallentina SM41]
MTANAKADDRDTRRLNRVQIVARKNGVGIDRDVNLIEDALRDQVDVEWQEYRDLDSIWSSVTRLLVPKKQCQDGCLNLLAERVPRNAAMFSGKVALIPNQERYPRRHLKRLRYVDQVLCKTRHAVEVFSRYAEQATYIGFTSEDRILDSITPDYGRFFHLAGRSTLKGTSMLIDLWSQHPDWPELTIVQSASNAPSSVPHNVRLMTEYVEDDSLRAMQNQHGIHLCPSRSEGWGHYIVEGMSCGAVVVTTDGPPMNELVDETRGVLVKCDRSEPRHLGINWFVNPAAMQKTIENLLEMSEEEKSSLGANARRWFVDNHEQFESRFRDVVRQLMA